eukprot:TRINITY_DN50108_c0_g1_i1.p1 TRINITY_DN50108_c0_g1~~TRINITY_DN50108_c0_g1_i1.p1  ORF type:complete len:298 (-),score=32.01 TRINITY_DN50108_c0_g1_i1:205-1098(-)
MDFAVKEALLKDPRVQESLRRAGGDALQDRAVQQQILSVCQDRFPEAAEYVAEHVGDWAEDPETLSMVKSTLASAAFGAQRSLVEAPHHLLSLIEQGPSGVRVLAFAGGAMSAILAALYMLNIVSQVEHPIDFILDMYQLFFSLTTMLCEADPETLESESFVSRWYKMANEWMPFLGTAFGRGVFMIFQGILWLHDSDLEELFAECVGFYMVFIGFVLVSLHWGYTPSQISGRIRESSHNLRHGLRQAFLSANSESGPAAVAAPPRSPADLGEGNAVEMGAVTPATAVKFSTDVTEH